MSLCLRSTYTHTRARTDTQTRIHYTRTHAYTPIKPYIHGACSPASRAGCRCADCRPAAGPRPQPRCPPTCDRQLTSVRTCRTSQGTPSIGERQEELTRLLAPEADRAGVRTDRFVRPCVAHAQPFSVVLRVSRYPTERHSLHL